MRRTRWALLARDAASGGPPGPAGPAAREALRSVRVRGAARPPHAVRLAPMRERDGQQMVRERTDAPLPAAYTRCSGGRPTSGSPASRWRSVPEPGAAEGSLIETSRGRARGPAPSPAAPAGEGAAALARLERLRRAYVRARAKLRAVRKREQRGPLSPAAAAARAALCRQADRLRQELLTPGRAAGQPDGGTSGDP